jgi:hypothetical protein
MDLLNNDKLYNNFGFRLKALVNDSRDNISLAMTVEHMYLTLVKEAERDAREARNK